ncbi:MAG: hypothetical protein AABX51_02880 [Nanoarchaeota archaeon]
MIKGGKGGARTLTGLKFESRISLKERFNTLKGYSVKDGVLTFKGREVAQLYKKYELYSKLLDKQKIKWKEIIAKKLLPDDMALVFSNKTLYIIEMKFQAVGGSVDEKLQTCHFKLGQYKKLLSGTDLKVQYVYVLNDWFKKPEYKDVLNYIREVGCHYFFEELPLDFLGLPIPK